MIWRKTGNETEGYTKISLLNVSSEAMRRGAK